MYADNNLLLVYYCYATRSLIVVYGPLVCQCENAWSRRAQLSEAPTGLESTRDPRLRAKLLEIEMNEQAK